MNPQPSGQSGPGAFTALLSRASDGDSQAIEFLLPIVYDELRSLASAYFAEERRNHTLQPTAIVHEAFIRLAGAGDFSWNDRSHFFRAAALAMRRVLVNHARDRGRLKRGGGQKPEPLSDEPESFEALSSLDLLALDDALTELGSVDPRKEQVVQLRFFGGCSTEDTARLLEISEAQVKRDWVAARAFLITQLKESE